MAEARFPTPGHISYHLREPPRGDGPSWVPSAVASPPPSYAWPAGSGQGQAIPPWEPPSLCVTFDGNPDKVALFLGQVIDHMDRYAHLYTSQWTMVMAIAAVLEDEAADWVADLYKRTQ